MLILTLSLTANSNGNFAVRQNIQIKMHKHHEQQLTIGHFTFWISLSLSRNSRSKLSGVFACPYIKLADVEKL